MPVRNLAAVVDAQMAALAQQAPGVPWELVVVDHGSADATVAHVERWAERLPSLKVVDGRHLSAIPELRNLGVAEATGSMVVHCDGDDVVGTTWLAAMVEALGRGNGLVTGPLEMRRLNRPDATAWRRDMPDDRPPSWHQFLPSALTCNLGVRREVIDAIGGFQPAFRSGSDVDFAWRAQEAGFLLEFSPGAVVHRRVPDRPFAWWRRNLRYGRYEPLLYRSHRSVGMPRSSLVRAVAAWGWLAVHVIDLARPAPRYRWLAHCGDRAGRLVGSVEQRVAYL
jgi:glycosyltransferase involved in cell wall biosynthesis